MGDQPDSSRPEERRRDAKHVDRRGPQRFRDLEAAIDAVEASYDEDYVINNLKSSALPNRRAVVEAVRHLLPVVLMGFFTRRSLKRDNLRHSIAEHLYAAHEILTEQIDRALSYERRIGRADENLPDCGGEDIVLKLVNALPELRRIIDTDVRAAYEGDPAAASIEEVVFSYPSVFAITCYRIASRGDRRE